MCFPAFLWVNEVHLFVLMSYIYLVNSKKLIRKQNFSNIFTLLVSMQKMLLSSLMTMTSNMLWKQKILQTVQKSDQSKIFGVFSNGRCTKTIGKREMWKNLDKKNTIWTFLSRPDSRKTPFWGYSTFCWPNAGKISCFKY